MTQSLKIILLAAVSAFAGAYIADHFGDIKLDTSQRNAEHLVARITELQGENEQLISLLNNKKFNRTTISDVATNTQPGPPTPSTDQFDKTASENQSQDDQVLQTSEKFSNWLEKANSKNESFNLREEMRRRFDAETIDHHWAGDQEQKYLTLFSQNPELTGLALRETQCRTQQCALTISIRDIGQANELLEKMTKALQQQKQYPLIIATPDEQRGITTLYIGKDASSFEFN